MPSLKITIEIKDLAMADFTEHEAALERMQTLVAEVIADVVILLADNDVADQAKIDAATARLNALSDQLRAGVPDAPNPPPPDEEPLPGE